MTLNNSLSSNLDLKSQNGTRLNPRIINREGAYMTIARSILYRDGSL